MASVIYSAPSKVEPSTQLTSAPTGLASSSNSSALCQVSSRR